VALVATAVPAGAAIRPRTLSHRVGFNAYPAWTPDGTRIVFASSRRSLVPRVCLWVTAADTDTAAQVTWGKWDDLYPSIHPDGKSVLFASNRGGEFNLYRKRFEPDSTWALNLPGQVNQYARWFKDGRRIVYESVRDTMVGVYVRDLETGAETCLFKSPMMTYFPALSPDETEVFFTSAMSKVSYDIFRVPVAGGETRVWSEVPGVKMSAIFTPDGQHILFARANEKGLYELWVAPVNAPLAAHRIETGLPNSYYPAFSPDGRRLAFCSKDDTGAVDLWVADWPAGEVNAP
jgi:Tol biopolymer transport system component